MTDKKNDIIEEVSDNKDIVDVIEVTDEVKIDEADTDVADEIVETKSGDETAVSEEPTAVAPVIVKRGGFFPMVLGGFIAAGLGYGVAHYVPLSTFGITLPASEREAEIDQKFADFSTQLAQLEGAVANAPVAPDFSADIAAVQSNVDGVQSDISDLTTKIIEIEKRPISSGDASGAVAAYETELRAMQDRITTIADEATAKIAAAEAKATELEQSASLVSNAALARAALMRVETAVARGGAFSDALADFAEMSGEAVPAELQAASLSGIATLSELQSSFPDVARDALAASRKENASGDAIGRVGAFLKTQVNARSLTPREGTDPDAVLSRVEAALRDDRLDVALTEIQGLPASGQGAISEWTSAAQGRLDAVSALQALALGEKG